MDDGSVKNCPLPLTSSEFDNLYRYDAWDAIALHHVFRDPWERRISPEKPWIPSTRSTFDYPSVNRLFATVKAAVGDEPDENASASTGENIAPWSLSSPPDDEPHEQGLSDHTDPSQSWQIQPPAADGDFEPAGWPMEAFEGDCPSPWILQHGGHLGHPKGSVRLPYQGSPEYQEKLRRQELQPLATDTPNSQRSRASSTFSPEAADGNEEEATSVVEGNVGLREVKQEANHSIPSTEHSTDK